MEGQAFSRSFALASRTPLPSPSPARKPDRWHTLRLRKRDNLLTELGERGGGVAQSYDREKAWSSVHVNHSILSVGSYDSWLGIECGSKPDESKACYSCNILFSFYTFSKREGFPLFRQRQKSFRSFIFYTFFLNSSVYIAATGTE